MVRLGALLLSLMLAPPVAAECFAGKPTEVDFGQGRVVTILSRTALDVTYRAPLPKGGDSVTTTRGGLFPMVISQGGVALRYEWLAPLPKLADLAPGQGGLIEADMVVEGAASFTASARWQVLREDEVTVAGCVYPVIVATREDEVNGRVEAKVTLWLSRDLGFPLRTEAVTGGKTTRVQAVAIR